MLTFMALPHPILLWFTRVLAFLQLHGRSHGAGKSFRSAQGPAELEAGAGDTEEFSEQWDDKDLCSAGAAGAEPGGAAAAL